MGKTTKKKEYETLELLEAIEGSNGNMSTIAERLGCSWATARHYVGEDGVARERYKGEVEKMLDKAEQIILDSLDRTANPAEQLATAKWLLAAKGGNRGYGTKTAYSNVLHGYITEKGLDFTEYETSIY